MRKRIIGSENAPDPAQTNDWLDLVASVGVELTSEDPDHSIEAALRHEVSSGWRAATPGPQTIRLIFDQPQPIRRVRLVFRETIHQRTQQFVLRWSADAGQTYHEVVRQQYNFSPPGTTEEVEEYRLELAHVTVLALEITPDIDGRPYHAALTSLQVG